MKLSIYAIMMMVLAGACRLIQPANIPPAPTKTSISTVSLESPPIPGSTHTLAPVPTLNPTATPRPSSEAVEIGPFRQVTSLADQLPDPSSEVQVRPLADGSVWILTSQAALRWDGQAWEDILSESEDFLATVDEDGRLWVLRQNRKEIAVWQDGQWTIYDQNSGWTEAVTFEPNWWSTTLWSAVTDAGSTLWLPMAYDVRAFNGDQWTVYSLEEMGFLPPEGEEIEIIHRLAMRYSDTEVWVGECYYSGPGPMGGQGVRWFDGKTWRGADVPLGAKCVSVLYVDSGENVWLGSTGGIWRYEPGDQKWSSYRLPEGMLSGYNFGHSLQLMVDEAGDVWVIMQMCGGASCDGPANLYRIHDGEWSLIAESEYRTDPLKQLAVDDSGGVWLFWDGSVYRLEGESMGLVTHLEVRSVGVSPAGGIWVVASDEEDLSLWRLVP